MAKHTLTHKKFQTDSGERSGIYLFTDGVLMFAPLTDKAVHNMMVQAVKHGPANMVRCIEHMALHATAPSAPPTVTVLCPDCKKNIEWPRADGLPMCPECGSKICEQ